MGKQTKSMVSFRFDPKRKAAIEEYAKRIGMTFTQAMNNLISDALYQYHVKYSESYRFQEENGPNDLHANYMRSISPLQNLWCSENPNDFRILPPSDILEDILEERALQDMEFHIEQNAIREEEERNYKLFQDARKEAKEKFPGKEVEYLLIDGKVHVLEKGTDLIAYVKEYRSNEK